MIDGMIMRFKGMHEWLLKSESVLQDLFANNDAGGALTALIAVVVSGH